jgi:hypothetical protein
MPFFPRVDRTWCKVGSKWLASVAAALLSMLMKFEFQGRISISAGEGHVTDAHGLSSCTHCQALFLRIAAVYFRMMFVEIESKKVFFAGTVASGQGRSRFE